MQRLKEMIKDEKKAPGEYKKLLREVKPKDRKVIKGIIKDERKHLRKLNKLRKSY